MKNGLLRLIVVGFLMLVFLSGCSHLQDKGLWQEPNAKVVTSQLVELNLQQALLEVELEVSNPNPFAINLGVLDYQLDIQGAKVLSGQQQQANRLEANGVQHLTLPVVLNFSDLGQLVSNLPQKNQLDYAVAGGLSFDLPLVGLYRVPFQVSGELPIPQLPRFSLVSLKQQQLSFSGAELLLGFEFNNPNSFDLLVRQLSYSLELNGQPLIEGRLPEGLSLQAEDLSYIEVPVSLAFGRSARALLDSLMQGGDLSYQLKVDSQLGSSLPALGNLPFTRQQTGQVRLSR